MGYMFGQGCDELLDDPAGPDVPEAPDPAEEPEVDVVGELFVAACAATVPPTPPTTTRPDTASAVKPFRMGLM